MIWSLSLQNVKAVFDAAIKVVLQPPKQKKKKRKSQKACSILWGQQRITGFVKKRRRLVTSLTAVSLVFTSASLKRKWCIVSTDMLGSFTLKDMGWLFLCFFSFMICKTSNFLLICTPLAFSCSKIWSTSQIQYYGELVTQDHPITKSLVA